MSHLDVLVNAIYWDPRYPRLVTEALLQEQHGLARLRLRLIGDISCDIDGTIECTVRATKPGEPVFVYNPQTGVDVDGYEGDGVVVMAVDILPSGPATRHVERLQPRASALFAGARRGRLRRPLRRPGPAAGDQRAVVVHRGELTRPAYRYLHQHLGSEQ